jgi:glycosyltransferase involved in cell wall biosynthesis
MVHASLSSPLTRGARPSPPIEVHQVLATLGYGDAIGHEVLGIQRVLRSAGYRSDIFVETADPRVEDLTRDYRELSDCSAPENILVHHFSIKSRASRVAFALPDRMILVYHNITPPGYFVDMHDDLVELCYLGRRELSAYAPRVQLALGDSEFNRRELEAAGFTPTGVLPVVPDFSHLDVEPNRLMAGAFDDEHVNVLFVGRVIPNKKIEDVIRFFGAYHRLYNPRSRLLIVGSYGGFEQYYAMLQEFIARRGIRNVHFTGHVSNEELAAYYEVADVFLCASEHEGFCVPLVEAFHEQIPVLAFAASAVPATMDGAGILYDRKDEAHVAALLDAVTGDERLRAQIVEGQNAALDRLERKDFGRCLLAFVEQVAAAPRPAAAAVSPDFWQQFEEAERLEELRLYRPGIYKALPKRA